MHACVLDGEREVDLDAPSLREELELFRLLLEIKLHPIDL